MHTLICATANSRIANLDIADADNVVADMFLPAPH
jgi:hypothetical protein